MAKTKLKKQEILRDLSAKLGRAKSVVFARFTAVKVVDNELLRNQMRAEASEYYVAKKTLLNLALKEAGMSGFDTKETEGQLAVVFGYEDEVAPAKLLGNFIKEHKDQVTFLGGILEGRLISGQQVTALSVLPAREELYAKLVGSINAPVSGFVNALAGNLRNLVGVLNAIQEKRT